jgi:hypothetical protein
MKTVPLGSVEWFMKGALRVGGIAGGGYVLTAGSAELARVGMPVMGGRLILLVEVLNCGRVAGPRDVEDDFEDDVEVSLSFSEVDWVVVAARAVVVVVWGGGLRAVVVVGFGSSCFSVVVAGFG